MRGGARRQGAGPRQSPEEASAEPEEACGRGVGGLPKKDPSDGGRKTRGRGNLPTLAVASVARGGRTLLPEIPIVTKINSH